MSNLNILTLIPYDFLGEPVLAAFIDLILNGIEFGWAYMINRLN